MIRWWWSIAQFSMILAHIHPLSPPPPPSHHPLKLSLLHSITKVHNPAINFLITWQEHIFGKDNSNANTWYLAFSVALVFKIIPRSQELEIYLESCNFKISLPQGMFFTWSISDIWQISLEKWKPIDIRESTCTVK